jgi:tetratricopeptide (TPR) repeat protein
VASLEAAFAQADGGHGQVVFVVGEPGIGKSRLLLELRRRIADRAAWQEGHCLSFGRAMAFHPLIDLLRRRFGIEEADDESTIVAKIDGALRELGDDVVSTAPYLRALLSVDPGDGAVRAMDPAQRRGETFEAVRRLFVRAAERRPQVLVIEDLHWIDSASEDFLAALVDSVPALRILVVFTYRPGYANRFGERSYFTRIVPAALTPDDTARMAAAVLAADDVPASLRALVSEKAEGNPFYVEELVKSLAESGALQQGLAGRAIPDTIHDVIAARIDRLADAPKRTLQLAAVVGREFTRRIVERLAEVGGRTDELMRELTSLELIHERRRYPELAYMFKHALTQDVAYDSLLVQRRKELHALVGRAIEELYADRPAEHYEMLAHHFSKAEEWERALDYQLKAADKARRAFGLRQALELYGGALDAARHLSERVPVGTILEIHRARADLYFAVGDFGRSREEADVLVAMSARVGDRRAEADALMLAATAWQWYEDFPRARENARRAIDIARAVGAPEAESGALAVLGYMRSLNGLMDEGRDQLDRSLAIARRVGDAARETYVLQLLSMMRGWQGDYRGSLALSDEGLTIARTHGLAPGYLRNLWNRGLAFNDLGDYDAALRALTEGLALAEKIGDDAFIPRYLNTIGWLRIEAGDLTGGIALSERAYEATERSSRAGHGTGAERRAFIRNNEADAFMARGDFAAAAAAIDESHHTVLHPPPSRWMTWRYGTHCHASRGQLALLRGDADGARRCADESLEIATATRSRKFESWAWRIKGESATMRHAWPEAEEALRRALAIAESIHHPRQTWLAHGALGRLQDGLGRRDDADASYAAAVQLIAAARLRANDPGVRTGLETLPAIRVIEDRASRSSR